MPPKAESSINEVEDSASSGPAPANKQNSGYPSDKGKSGKGGKNNQRNKSGNTSNIGANPNARNPQPSGFAEGNKALENYGLSVSGRKERVLSAVKTEKYFHLVEDCWKQLVDAKPAITERFSYHEFRHASALQLYSRLEQVKFDAIGVKPSAPTRIPLPRNLRVFLPIWSILSEIGIVDDDDHRTMFIPDSILPKSKDLDTDEDVENLLSCTLYDWSSSWNDVLKARESRDPYDERIGYTVREDTTEQPSVDRANLVSQIAAKRREIVAAKRRSGSSSFRLIGDSLYKIPPPPSGHTGTWKPTDEEIKKGEAFDTPDELQEELEDLMKLAKQTKEDRIRPRFDRSYTIDAYTFSDGTLNSDPGAYGAWLHWDPELWLEYEQLAELLSGICMFSMSMPVDTSGTYAWLLPVESRGTVDVFCKMPKASIPPVTWIKAMILQSSTLPFHQRSTWYTETDALSNLTGLRARYIRAAIKRAAPTDRKSVV